MPKPSHASPRDLPEHLGALLLQGGTLGDLLDYSEQDCEVIYTLGHGLYSQGRYQDAVKAFGFLVVHSHLEPRYIRAFAASLQMCGRHEEALLNYSLASVFDMSDPVPTFHSCECLLALGRMGEAGQGLGMVIRQCKQPRHAALRQRAQALLSTTRASTARAKKEPS